MPTNLEKFRDLLRELFQLDQADLDFGIYRIMNQKRDEILRFLDKDLLPQVKAAFAEYQATDKAALQTQLDEAIKKAKDLGADADGMPTVKEIRQKLYAEAVDITKLENEVFSHLFTFFRRYYQDGDFISLRRYKEGVYAIPYEGEEVKLYWANHDQYYIKSSETFRDYTFKLDSGKRVNIRIVAASTEQNNNKEASGKERRFILCPENPLSEENGELHICFEYRPSEGREKQSDLNQAAIATILNAPGIDQWAAQLGKAAPSENNSNRTVLEKHLTKFTARNEFDYFIHKDLGGFLRRELDFYIKNEVMHLDDIENDSVPRVEQYLSLIRVIRKIAHKIIAFLEQLENFQKKLWLKKKFVIETHYCITLDRIPEELYAEIAANDAQREEWVKLFAIDEIRAEKLGEVAYSKPLTVEFLKSQPHLVLDTKHLHQKFKQKLLASIHDLDEKLNGMLIHSENFQALQLISERYSGKVDCVYIDPPYNTGNDGFPYKDGYIESSWLTMAIDRATCASRVMSQRALFFQQIGDEEAAHSRLAMDLVFAERKNSAVARRGVKNVQAQFNDIDRLNQGYDLIHVYSAQRGLRVPHLSQGLEESNPGKWDTFWRGVDRPTMRYPLFGQSPQTGQWRWESGRALRAAKNYEKFIEREASSKSLDDWYVENLQAGVELDFVRCNEEAVVQYYVPPQNYRLVSDNWLDVPAAGSATDFVHEKSLALLERIIRWATRPVSSVLDYFAGSGTTAHAVINLNREDGGNRKYILVEMGVYFHTVLLPRIKKVVYSKDWKDGKPIARDTGISHAFKYLRLESYEDALANLELSRTKQQSDLLNSDSAMREQYMLSYMLDVESRGSQSLLNIDAFRNPDQYKLRVERNGETQLVDVDLPETFNWLLGLTVKHIDVIRGVRVIDGKNPKGDRVLVLWRDMDEMDNDKLDQWFQKQNYNTRELEYDIFYVNGDNNLENLRRPDQTWKVRLIEEEFKRLMFDSTEV